MKRVAQCACYLFIALLTGCKPHPPQVAGRWHGSSHLSANYKTALSSTPRNESVPAEFVLVLTQTGQTVQGDASVTAARNKPIHIPIGTGVVQPDGKLSLEGDSSFGLARAHLSFDGKVEPGKIMGTVNVALNNVSGTAENKGSLTLTPSN